MDSLRDTTSNNESELGADESFYASSAKELNFSLNKTETVDNNIPKCKISNTDLKERLISVQNHLQRIEDKKKNIDQRQVKHYSF